MYAIIAYAINSNIKVDIIFILYLFIMFVFGKSFNNCFDFFEIRCTDKLLFNVSPYCSVCSIAKLIAPD